MNMLLTYLMQKQMLVGTYKMRK